MTNRLASMEPVEIPFRMREWWRMKTAHSWTPPSIPHGIFHCSLPKWPNMPHEIPSNVHQAAETILKEGVVLLGEQWSIEELWNWGWDPSTGIIWPQVPSHEIELRFADADIKPAWELLKLQHLQVLAWSAHGGNQEGKCDLEGNRARILGCGQT